MKFTTARAFQIATMDRIQVEDLHVLENNLGHCMVNWNIQDRFRLPTIRDFFRIPDDETIMKLLGEKLDRFLSEHKLHYTETGGIIDTVNITVTHEFDWNIWHKKDLIQSELTIQSRRSKLTAMAEG